MGQEEELDGTLAMTSYGTTGDDYDTASAADPYGLDASSEDSTVGPATSGTIDPATSAGHADPATPVTTDEAAAAPDSPAKAMLRASLPTDPASRRRAAAALLRSVLVVKRGNVR